MPTYTYSGNPATSPTDEIRFLLKERSQTDLAYMAGLFDGDRRGIA